VPSSGSGSSTSDMFTGAEEQMQADKINPLQLRRYVTVMQPPDGGRVGVGVGRGGS